LNVNRDGKGRLATALAIALSIILGPPDAHGQADPADWSMYNRDVIGTRYNPASRRSARGMSAAWRRSGDSPPRAPIGRSA